MLGSSIAATVEGGWEETHRALHRHSQTSTGTFWMGQFAADGAAVANAVLDKPAWEHRASTCTEHPLHLRGGENREPGTHVGLGLFALKSYGDCLG